MHTGSGVELAPSCQPPVGLGAAAPCLAPRFGSPYRRVMFHSAASSGARLAFSGRRNAPGLRDTECNKTPPSGAVSAGLGLRRASSRRSQKRSSRCPPFERGASGRGAGNKEIFWAAPLPCIVPIGQSQGGDARLLSACSSREVRTQLASQPVPT